MTPKVFFAAKHSVSPEFQSHRHQLISVSRGDPRYLSAFKRYGVYQIFRDSSAAFIQNPIYFLQTMVW